MRAALLALPITLVALAAATPAFSQLRGNPVQNPFVPIGDAQGFLLAPLQVPSFGSYREFYAHLAKERGLENPESDFAVQQIESQASLDQLRDYSGDPVTVVKLDSKNADGNYSFFVMRQKADHLVLLGKMSGHSYETSTRSGHLEFVLDVGNGVAQAPRYQVDGDFLINLADLASLDRNDPVVLDINRAF